MADMDTTAPLWATLTTSDTADTAVMAVMADTVDTADTADMAWAMAVTDTVSDTAAFTNTIFKY